MLFYFAAHTDGGCLIGCSHTHHTVTSATACISSAGGYVLAIENSVLRVLTAEENAEFEFAMHGVSIELKDRNAAYDLLVTIRFKASS
jgi:hypothetical protein